jgi:hypothetical protein
VERLLGLWVDDLIEERPDGSSLRAFADLLDALVDICPFVEPVRLGFLTLPLRGPSRFFGGDEAVFAAVRAAVGDVTGGLARIGVAEGLFATELASRQSTVVPAGGTTAFRRAQPLDVLGRKEVATTGRRLGLYTVGAFADLAPARVNERFSGAVRVVHRVARGEIHELPDQRDRHLPQRLRGLRGSVHRADEQSGFFGQRSTGDDRAAAAVYRLRHRLGVEGVLVAELHGGRSPDDRARLVPWDAPRTTKTDVAPWPGQLGAPAPTTSFTHPVAVEIYDESGAPVRCSVRGHLSGTPSTVALTRAGKRRVQWSAGPWPLVEHWWTTPRRRAHVQIVLEDGIALLLTTEAGRWWLTGMYD